MEKVTPIRIIGKNPTEKEKAEIKRAIKRVFSEPQPFFPAKYSEPEITFIQPQRLLYKSKMLY